MDVFLTLSGDFIRTGDPKNPYKIAELNGSASGLWGLVQLEWDGPTQVRNELEREHLGNERYISKLTTVQLSPYGACGHFLYECNPIYRYEIDFDEEEIRWTRNSLTGSWKKMNITRDFLEQMSIQEVYFTPQCWPVAICHPGADQKTVQAFLQAGSRQYKYQCFPQCVYLPERDDGMRYIFLSEHTVYTYPRPEPITPEHQVKIRVLHRIDELLENKKWQKKHAIPKPLRIPGKAFHIYNFHSLHTYIWKLRKKYGDNGLIVIKPNNGFKGIGIEVCPLKEKEKIQSLVGKIAITGETCIVEPCIPSEPTYNRESGGYHTSCIRHLIDVRVQWFLQPEISVLFENGYDRLCPDTIDSDNHRRSRIANLTGDNPAIPQTIREEEKTVLTPLLVACVHKLIPHVQKIWIQTKTCHTLEPYQPRVIMSHILYRVHQNLLQNI